MQHWHHAADKGYVGLGYDTPLKRRPGKPLLEWQRRFNKGINQIRYVIERSIAHLKVWRILATPCRLFRTITQTLFPQQLNKLQTFPLIP